MDCASNNKESDCIHVFYFKHFMICEDSCSLIIGILLNFLKLKERYIF